jgi:hypothetical protein
MNFATLISTARRWFTGAKSIQYEPQELEPSSSAPLTSTEIVSRLTQIVRDPTSQTYTRSWAADWLQGFNESGAT